MIKQLLIIAFVLMLAVGATARDSLEVWVGGTFTDMTDPDTWMDTITVSFDQVIDIPVYLRGQSDSVYIDNLCYPIGIQLCYIDEFAPGWGYPRTWDILYPFSDWCIKQFGNFNDENGGGPGGPTPPGWISLSFLGFRTESLGPPFPCNPGTTPGTEWPNIVHSFTYEVHITADNCYAGQTICDALGPGIDHGQGIANAGDTLGGAGYKIIQHFACLRFPDVAHRGTITGTVSEIYDGPIENVHVVVYAASCGEDWTGPDGSYSISDIPYGVHDMIFSHPDYVDTVQANFNVNNETNILDMEMWPLPEDDVVFWVGNLDGSPLTAPVGGWININVYLQTSDTAFGADIHFALAVEDQYFDQLNSIAEGVYYYPFTEWDSAGFEGPFGSPPNPVGWSSESFRGYVDSLSSSPWLNFALPSKILTFAVKVIDDTLLIGDTVECLGIGVHPDGWPFGVSDTLGSLYSSVEYFSEVAIAARPLGFAYLPGDANMYLGIWPPQVIGSDKTYLSNYFLGITFSQPCLMIDFWVTADVNGDCLVLGSDVTKLTNYLRGIGSLNYCPLYQPLWLTPDDLPEDAPPGWPNCENSPVTSNIIPVERNKGITPLDTK